MTNKEMLEIAMKQSAEDIGCTAADFLKEDNVVVSLRLGKNARKYLWEPINGIKSGFAPAWVEMTAKPIKIVDDMNSNKKGDLIL